MAVAHRIYARALFDAAKEEGRLERVREEFGDFVTAIAEVPELRELLRNPQVDPRARAAALDDVLGDADELVRNFLRLLSEKGRIGQVEATRSVDPNLIGGVVLQAGSLRVDASIRGRLERLRHELVTRS